MQDFVFRTQISIDFNQVLIKSARQRHEASSPHEKVLASNLHTGRSARVHLSNTL